MGKGSRSSHAGNFHVSGPRHSNQVDWGNENHRMCAMACLIQAVYVLRLDTKEGRKGYDAIGRRWWGHFHFKSPEVLSDESRTFGAIFELDHSRAIARGVKSLDKAPRFVVAIRGTQSLTDVIKDFRLIVERLENDKRTQRTIDRVKEIIPLAHRDSRNGDCGVWLAGHSLGASVCTCVGMQMANDGIFLETYLFNPPFLRLAPETLKHKSIKWMVRLLEKIIYRLMKNYMEICEGGKMKGDMCRWVTNLYLNPDDYISKGFIPYFNNQELFEGVKPGLITRVKKEDGFHDLYACCGGLDSHCLYHILSAKVFINKKTPPPRASNPFRKTIGKLFKIKKFFKKLVKAHSIEQWCRFDLDLEFKEYIYSADASANVVVKTLSGENIQNHLGPGESSQQAVAEDMHGNSVSQVGAETDSLSDAEADSASDAEYVDAEWDSLSDAEADSASDAEYVDAETD